MQTKTIKLTDLIPDDKNANKGTERGLALLDNSLRTYGAGRSILLDKNNRIIAGNKTTERAADIGLENVLVVETTGDTLVAVKRTDLDLKKDKQAKELAIADNRVAQVDLAWDAAVIEELTKEIDLEQFFSKKELNQILSEVTNVPGLGGDDFDTTPVEGDTRTKLGDLWECAGHRLLVGDCTLATNIDKLFGDKKPVIMVTDPPYGVEYDPSWREGCDLGVGQRSKGKVLNDNKADWSEAYSLFTGDIAYIWHAGRHAKTVQANLEDCDFNIINQIIWVKQHFVMSRGDYHWQHEPCWYAVRKGKTHSWSGDRKQTTTWEIANNNSFGNSNKEETFGHGTQKPIECMSRPIQNHGKPGDIVYDPFLGSGTTIIAAQRLKRFCYGCELNPVYADIILKRIEAETGQTAKLISNGNTE